jgi:capsular polysaccharide transport system ATP-binding protein
MIELRDVFDTPTVAGEERCLALGVSMSIPRGRYAVVSRDPLLPRPTIDLFAGSRPPRRGVVYRSGVCSWPIGRPGVVRGRLTGVQIVAFIARIYRLDAILCACVVKDAMTNPRLLNERVEYWPLPDRIEFGLLLALLPKFDIYVVDGNLPYRNDRFSRLWTLLFDERIANATLIVSATRTAELKVLCDRAIIIQHGDIWIEKDLAHVLSQYSPAGKHVVDAGAVEPDLAAIGADLF